MAALTFVRTFYAGLGRGERFADAIGAARAEAYDVGGPTWGAFQCYGDPDWVLRPNASPTTPVRPWLVPTVPSSKALVLALKTIATQFQFGSLPLGQGLEQIEALEREHT